MPHSVEIIDFCDLTRISAFVSLYFSLSDFSYPLRERERVVSYNWTNRQSGSLPLSLQVPEYQLTVVASDGGSPRLSATMDTVVIVIDANDHAPRFEERQYAFDVREDVDVGAVIGRVSATDDDEGDNAVITYSFSRRTQVQHSTRDFFSTGADSA